MKLLLNGLFCIACVLMFNETLYAHPHVFIENSVAVKLNNKGVEGLIITWVFDEIFSSMVINDYDTNANQQLETNEIKQVKDEMFSNLEAYHYFLYIIYNNKNLPVKTINNFSAAIKDHKISYSFTLPLDLAAGTASGELKIGVFDSTYYCEIFFSKNKPVTVGENPALEYTYSIKDDKTKAYWGGQIIPKFIVLKFKIKEQG